MNLKTLANKIIKNGKLIIAQPTIFFKNRNKTNILVNHTVTNKEQGRPDLLALKHYGNTDMIGVLLKFNGIKDPFSIKEGDNIQIPNQNVAFSKLERPDSIDESNAKMQFVENKRLSQKDKNRKEALKKKYSKENLLPPNVVPVGKKGYKFKQNTTQFGQQAQSNTSEANEVSIAQDLSPNENLDDIAENIDIPVSDPIDNAITVDNSSLERLRNERNNNKDDDGSGQQNLNDVTSQDLSNLNNCGG